MAYIECKLKSQRLLTTVGVKIYLPCDLPVEVGKTYRFVLASSGGSMNVWTGGGSYDLGLRLTFNPAKATSGSLVTKAVSPGSAQALRAWVRHLNGTVTMAVRQGSGSWVTLTKSGTRSTVNADGVSCTESAFTLTRALSGSLSFRLTLSTPSGVRMRVYDYGVILL